MPAHGAQTGMAHAWNPGCAMLLNSPEGHYAVGRRARKYVHRVRRKNISCTAANSPITARLYIVTSVISRVQVRQEGRTRTYKSRLSENPCEPEACVPFTRNIMQALDKVVMDAAEKHDLAHPATPSQLPEIGVHELRLRPEEARHLVEALKAVLPEVHQQVSVAGDPYTVSFVVTPGKVSDYF